jgi:hypothetical protein
MRATGLVLVTLLSGCSLIAVRGAPSTDPGYRPVRCTESLAPPVLDTIPAAVLLLITGAVLGDIANDPPGMEGRALAGGLVGIVFGIPGLVFAGSAYYGYSRTSDCRAMNRRPLPQPMGPPPGYPQGYPPQGYPQPSPQPPGPPATTEPQPPQQP